jgi:ribosomal protein S18 acetylase RimI-like enzyme
MSAMTPSTGPSHMHIRQVASSLELAQARELFLEYAAWLGVDLCFQHFDEELAGLPGAYALPRGRLLLADVDGQAAGCVALRPLSAEGAQEAAGDGEGSVGEIKRLWVRPAFRHLGLGRRLVSQVIEAAREAGYRRVLLDTLPQMESARALYQSSGFVPVHPYYDNPLPGVIYLGLDIDR